MKLFRPRLRALVSQRALPALLTAVLFVGLCANERAVAQDATWDNPATVAGPTPGTFDFNAATNWTPNTVPTGTAFFGASSTTALSFSAATSIGGWTFNVGASNYTFTNGQNLAFNGAGIVINGGSATITNNSAITFLNTSTAGSATITNANLLFFNNTSTAGSATITNSNLLQFANSSTAGSATITNNNNLEFYDTSTAGSATITNISSLLFLDASTAGSATITNSSVGLMQFLDSSTAGSAAITNNNLLFFFDTSTAGSAAITNNLGGVVDFSGSTGPGGLGALSAGSIAGAGNYELGSNSLTVGSNNLDTEVSGVISGAGGSLTKEGTGTLTLSGLNTYQGDTTVNAGTLEVTGQIQIVFVQSGGTLSGDGVVGDGSTGFWASAGGIVAPGAGRTMTVAGSSTFDNGAHFQVNVDSSGTTSSLDVAGPVILSTSILDVIAAAGNYAPSTSYTIITNDNVDGVAGQFTAITTNLAFLTPSVNYAGGDGNDVVLTMTRNTVDFSDEATTPNQAAVAGALEQLPLTNPLIVALLNQNSAGAQQAFDALSGEVHASLGGLLVDQSHFLSDAILARLLQAFYGSGGATNVAALTSGGPAIAALGGAPMLGLGMGSGGKTAPAPGSTGVVAWTQGFGSWGDFKSNGNAASADRTLGGFISGVDAGFGGGWRAGLAGGYTQTSASVDARGSSADIESYHLAAYAGGRLGPLALRSGAAWTWHDIETERAIVFPGFFQRADASYDGDTGQVFGELAMPLGWGTTALEAFGRLAYVHVSTGGFTESGGIAALSAGENTDNMTYSMLGARAATVMFIDGMQVTPHASAAWQHAYNDVTTDMALAFAGTNAGFIVSGVPIARDSAFIEAGLDFRIAPDATLGVSYQGQLASDVQDHGINGRLDWRF